MLRRLNGWQRLWVLATILYLGPVCVVAIDSFPKARDYTRTRVDDSIEAVGRYMETTTTGYTFEGAYAVRQKYYGDLSDDEIIDRISTKFKGKVDLSRIELEYLRKLDGLRGEQAKILGYALMWWLIPSLSLYLLGLAVAWVIRGFRGESRH